MDINFLQGLSIAGIGMGLVFLALIMLWGLMALMASIHFKSDEKGNNQVEEANPEPVEIAPVGEEDSSLHSLRMRAAAAAVAAALGLQVRTSHFAPPVPKELSPWQVARRSGQFSQTNMVTNRKSRGSAR